MEVHAHTHTERKKFTHYLWEFLMLFLAVFCGFLAENQREHMVEHQREKQYIQSIIEDLKLDTADVNFVISVRLQRESCLDSLIRLLKSPDRAKYGNEIYYCARLASRSVTFTYNDRTIQQLKNSGGMRMIRNKGISDSITNYDASVRFLLGLEKIESDVITNYRNIVGNVFDAGIFQSMVNGAKVNRPLGNPRLFRENPEEINRLCIQAHYMHTASTTDSDIELFLKDNAIRLINLLRKEYHLE